MKSLYLTPLALIIASHSIQAELIGLDETSLEEVSGQTGLTLEFHKQFNINEIRYSDIDGTTGESLQIKDIVVGNPLDVNNQQATSIHQIDLDGTDGLVIFSQYQPTRVQIGSISVGDSIGVRSFGSFQYDWEGSNTLKVRSNDGSGIGTEGLIVSNDTTVTNADFRWFTNGQAFQINDITYSASLQNMSIDVNLGGKGTYLALRMPTFSYDLTVGSLCFSAVDCVANNSLGSFSESRSFINNSVDLYGGGREGDGITIDAHIELDASLNAGGDGNVSSYTDENTIKFAKQSGSIDVTGFTFDLGRDETNIGDHIALQVDQVIGNFAIGDVSIAGNSVGAFEIQFNVSDGLHDSVTYENKSLIAPGIAFAAYDFSTDTTLANAGFDSDLTNFFSKVTNTSDGVSLYNEWNLTADFIYTDDGHAIIADNFQTWGSGYLTMDVRAGADSIDNTNDVSESFLAIGVRDYKINYTLDGFKIGDQNAQLQSGYELLGFAPDAEFTMNAGIEIRGGGAAGSGITLDGDVFMTDGNFAITKTILNYDDGDALNDRNIGLYLDGVNYEFHFRDVTLDVDNGGIQIVLGEIWSEMDIADVRFGDKNTGESIGGINVKQYKSGSQVTINGGGTNTRCVSGTGADAVSCEADGGYWLDAGSQGLTIASKQILNQRNGAKENSVTWTTNRTGPDGLSMKIDNIYTSDGYDDNTNTHGIQNTMTIDVARTRVIKKETGLDSNGISGSAGDELIEDGAGSYTYVTSPTDAQKANRPETLVLTNNVQIKELNIDSVLMKHPNAGTADTMINGIKLQNLNLNSTLSVSPIR